MPPKQTIRSSSHPQKSFMQTAYAEMTSPENFTIVRAIAVFGVRSRVCLLDDDADYCKVGVGLLSTGLGELLIPP